MVHNHVKRAYNALGRENPETSEKVMEIGILAYLCLEKSPNCSKCDMSLRLSGLVSKRLFQTDTSLLRLL